MPTKGLVTYMKQYNLNKQVREILIKINPLLAKRENNLRLHLEALIGHSITLDQVKVIEAKMKLGTLCLELEELISDCYVTMLFYSKDENKIYHGAAPNMQVEFFDFFNDINESNNFNKECGSCGYAVHNKKVIVTDIETDPLWGPFKEHFTSQGYKTGWSVPILNGNDVLGTFAIYHKYQKEVTKEEIKLVTDRIQEYIEVIKNVSMEFPLKEVN